MRFLKRHYKTTTLLFLVFLLVYISHLKDSVQSNVDEVVCWIKSETIQFNERIKKEDIIRFEEEVISKNKEIKSEDISSRI